MGGDIIAKLDSTWWNAFGGSCDEEEDVIEFIFERLDTKDFETSFNDCAGYGEPNEMVKQTADDKREILYDWMISLLKKQE